MNNVLLDTLPTEWEGYTVNTWFQVGVQAFLVYEDEELATWEKTNILIELLFEDEDGSLREHPTGEELTECIEWFINGWYHDGKSEGENGKYMDFDIDQYRIYADFLQIYGIDLAESNMHFWKFMGLLWNMPYKYSSFLNVIDIRMKEITSDMGKTEKQAIRKAKNIYGLEQKTDFDQETKDKIDDYDRMMARLRNKE